MEEIKKINIIENSLRIALQNLESLKKERDQTELSIVNDRLSRLESIIDELKKQLI